MCARAPPIGTVNDRISAVKVRVVIDAHVLQEVVGVACAEMHRHHRVVVRCIQGRGDARVDEAKFSGVCAFHIVSRQFDGPDPSYASSQVRC